MTIAYYALYIAVYAVCVMFNLIYIDFMSTLKYPRSKNKPMVYLFKAAFIITFIPFVNCIVTAIGILQASRLLCSSTVKFIKGYWLKLEGKPNA